MSGDASSFVERLSIALRLKIAGTERKIAGGSVRLVELALERHGFSGAVEFVILDDAGHGGGSRDELVNDFLGPEPGEVNLAIAAVFDAPEAATSPEPLAVAGIVVRRSLSEIHLRSHGDLPLMARRYRLEFCDPARALWTQHFPCRLYTETTLEEVLSDQLGDKITLRYSWSELSTTRAMVFVHLPVDHGASFYDFVIWLADRRKGHFTYDYTASSYALEGAIETTGAAAGLFGDDLADLRLVVPETPRHAVEVCNSYAEAATRSPIVQPHAATGIRHDLLLRSPIAEDADERVTLEKGRLVIPKVEAELRFARLPIVRVVPGGPIELVAANRWPASSAFVGKSWVVDELRLRAVAEPGSFDEGLQIADATFAISMSARARQSDDPRPSLPPHQAPRYPGLVEGKIACTLGEEGEKTWESVRDKDTSADEYAVTVPLWDDQLIHVPFAPMMGSGSVFLPCYRQERVLLALDFDRARIAALLEWREGAALSKDVQGEHIVWGKSATSNTSLSHVYEDQKPVLGLVRTHASDTVRITLSEGNLRLHVEEQKE